jgi:cyclopropane fatty-acyl-phospholipid synthase-like methyltransferase
MLAEARKAAEAANVGVELIRSDAVEFEANAMFDAAIIVCEGAFGLLGETEDPVTRDLTVLKNVTAALKPGGGFLITALSASRPLRLHTPEDIANGIFDPMTRIEHNTVDIDTPNGKMTFKSRERSFTVPELSLMCRIAGFDVVGAFGGTAGSWNKKPLDLDEYEIMLICRKR